MGFENDTGLEQGGAEDDDDDDLEAELAALTQGSRSKPKKGIFSIANQLFNKYLSAFNFIQSKSWFLKKS